MNRLQTILLILILFLTVFCYGHTMKSPFQFDDHTFIEESQLIRNISLFWNLDWLHAFLHAKRPITRLTFAVNYHLHGLDVSGYHMVNILLHLMTTVLVTVLLGKILGKMELSLNSKTWFMSAGAAIFALHPVQTETVTYLVQRAEGLASFFYILTFIFLIRFSDSTGRMSLFNYSLAVVFFLLGWGSKEIIASVPVLYLLYSVYCDEKGRAKKAVLGMVPVIAVTVVAGVIGLTGFGRGSYIGFQMRDLNPIEYFYTEMKVIITYLRLIFLPVNQNLDYDYPILRSLWDASVLVPMIVLAVLTFSSIAALRYRGRWRNHLRLMGFGFLWFIVILLPTSSVIPLKDVIFEHRVYLSMLGIMIAFLAGLHLIIEQRNWSVSVLTGFLVVVTLTLGGLTYKRNALWADSVALWEDTARKSPRKARVHLNLGNAYAASQRYDDAVEQFKITYRLSSPEDDERPKSIINLGALYFQLGRIEEAVELYTSVLMEYPTNPGILNNLAVCYIELGRPRDALTYAELSVRLKPQSPVSRNTLGESYLHLGRCSEALNEFRTASSLKQEDAGIYWNIAVAHLCLNNNEEAERSLQVYLNLENDPAARSRTLKDWMKLQQESPDMIP